MHKADMPARVTDKPNRYARPTFSFRTLDGREKERHTYKSGGKDLWQQG
jgi:hypothetical protein